MKPRPTTTASNHEFEIDGEREIDVESEREFEGDGEVEGEGDGEGEGDSEGDGDGEGERISRRALARHVIRCAGKNALAATPGRERCTSSFLKKGRSLLG